jgi:uncharacterized protein (DUF1800 family)
MSSDLTAAGDFTFKVGTLAVTAVKGGTIEILPGLKVAAYEKVANASPKWVAEGMTDDNGMIRFDLRGLDQGKPYLLRANSPWDGTTKWSNDITATGLFVFAVGNAPLRVTLVNAISGERLPNQKITVRERLGDGSSRWVTERTTDANGQVIFDLQGLGEGRVYFLTAKPYNGGTATSADLTAPGDFEFKVGKLEVTAVRPPDNSPLANLPVYAKERLADGSLRSSVSATTDGSGVIRFDLPGLGEGRSYVLEARSPVDGTTKRSDVLTATGRYTFIVGNAPLTVALMNALSGDPLPGMKITVSERLATGKLQWVNARTTDAAGRTQFDLNGLGSGRVYVLSCVPYNGGTVYSDDIRSPGQYDFKVGAVEVTAVRATDQAPLPGLKVTAKEKAADGKLTYVAQGTTDANGVIRFDFLGLKSGKTYVLEAQSPVDGSIKRSQDITAPGKVLFQVGNPPLVVNLRNAYSGQPLPGVSITVRERLSTGSLKWVKQGTTDASGQVLFDLDGLGSGRVYLLSCNPYGTGAVDSPDLTATGNYDFAVGTLEVAVVSGATGQPLPRTEVAAYEVQSTGRWKWSRGGMTDDLGVIRFDLPGLGSGRTYVLEAHSPIDGSHKHTTPLTQPGQITFVVGNAALRVMLINGLTNIPLAAAEITAYELLPNGETQWTSWTKTDAAGIALFDLDGLGDGRVYVLHTDPYDVGGVETPPLAMTGDLVMRAGTIPVALIDGDNDVPMPGVEISVYEKLPDGKLEWAAHAVTDANGIVQLDLEGVSATTPDSPAGTRVYVLKVRNPFGVEKRYYSGVIDREGPFEFRITRAGDYPLDVTPPTLVVNAPVDGGNADAGGFTVSGVAGDNATLTQVRVTVSDPVKGATEGAAAYDAATQRWSFPVSSAMVTVGANVAITVRAYDQARNQAVQTIRVNVIVDSTAPEISITSHQEGGEVEKTGFLLAGAATDDIGVTSLQITVEDPVLGVRVNQQPVDVTPGSGQWTFTVLNGQISQGQTISISLVATDAKGNTATAMIHLLVVAVDFEGTHLINRITFGSTPQLFTEVATIGADTFVTQQLTPQTIDDSGFDAMIAATPAPTTTAGLQRYALLHAIYSRRQLREVMTQFWDNHFNTDVNKPTSVAYELAENNLFRQNALSSFRNLLQVSATSPAMLLYLDNASSLRADPNENYARELLELHTMGVDGGYTQNDVVNVARIFTGWTVQNGQFFFNPAQHDVGAKIVLGQPFPAGGGVDEGGRLLDILANHPSTARFICTKLSRVFVSDMPPPSLVSRCIGSFLSSRGQMGTVVETILRSPEFADPVYFRAKVKTPLELVVAVARNLNAATDANDLLQPMRDLGMRLFENPVPTGWSETGDDWTNANAILQRTRFVNDVAYATPGGGATAVDMRQFFISAGYTTADGIVGFLLQMVFHHDYTPQERDVALAILTNNGTEVFDINAPNADARLRRLVATVFSFPGYQFQ